VVPVFDKIYYVIMVPMVYAAVSVFVIGVISRSIRIVLAPENDPSSLPGKTAGVVPRPH
jgi:hypothetical protein